MTKGNTITVSLIGAAHAAVFRTRATSPRTCHVDDVRRVQLHCEARIAALHPAMSG